VLLGFEALTAIGLVVTGADDFPGLSVWVSFCFFGCFFFLAGLDELEEEVVGVFIGVASLGGSTGMEGGSEVDVD
jgi:hypothetical protein